MQKIREELNEHPVGANCIRPHFEGITIKNQKGITLIALIVTIIVMLILVGVTINVALNGGMFEKGEKAVFQTGASTVKEQLEIAKGLKIMEQDGKPAEDYSVITVANLPNIDSNTISKFGNKIVVSKNGDICYNPTNVTDQEKIWLQEIGINALSGKSFYRVPYKSNAGGAEGNMYFFEEGICFLCSADGLDTFCYAMRYNEEDIIKTEDLSSISYMGTNWLRVEGEIYNRQQTYDKTNNIYLNSFYLSSTTGNVIFTTNTDIHCSGSEASDIFALTALETAGITIKEEGKKIEYQGNTYIMLGVN